MISASSDSRRVRLWVPIVAAGAVLAAGAVGWTLRSTGSWPEQRAKQLLEQARSLQASGYYSQAGRTAADALKLDPALGEAALLVAECAVAKGDFPRASEFARKVASDDPAVRVRATFMFAQLQHHRLRHFAEAERAYRDVLLIDPDHVAANSGLATLLCLCGRKREAVPFALQLVKLGVETDLLVLLSVDSGVVDDRAALEQARRADPTDPNPLVGLAWHAAQAEQRDEALELLRAALLRQPDHAAAHIALGQQLLESLRFDELAPWMAGAPQTIDDFADTWLIKARLSEHQEDARAAIRCYWEAVLRAPESAIANSQLARLLAEVGATQVAGRFAERVRRLQHLKTVQNRVLLFARQDRDVEPLLELAKAYEEAGRIWEAYGWCRVATRLDKSHPEASRYLETLQHRVQGLPLQLTTEASNVALSIDLSRYPLPQIRSATAVTVAESQADPAAWSFRDDGAAGLRFRYFNGVAGEPTKRMFEFTGGGIGVLDFDEDGFADLFFTQGRTWPRDLPDAVHIDCLYRNRDGEHFEDVSELAGIVESQFGQGVTVGDYNSDGFPDVYVANIGGNTLWSNHGDGTFADVTQDTGLTGDEWTTSTILADLSGDGLPDIYDVNYVTAPDVFDRVCRDPNGLPMLCMPFDFYAQPDRLWLNAGNGRFVDSTVELLHETPLGMGLGVAAWDAHGDGRLSLLVANDTTRNFYFVPETDADGTSRLRDRAIEVGLALNGDGKATGCMGVALGDVDHDRRLDVYITNFFAEPNTLYLNSSLGYFEDRTRGAGLYAPSFNMLGFGTQFLDVDLDGQLELFVANGHVDDLERHGHSYRMPPQLFRGDAAQRFTEVNAESLGAYFQRRWLGRAAARLDWNRDGREDLAIGQLQDNSVLLTNTTQSAGGFLSMRLIGVESNRDAIGTTVSARVGPKTFMRQLTAGDGYQASNDRRLIIGTGKAATVDELVVRWPSGKVQRFEQVRVSQELCLREGQSLLKEQRTE